MSRSSRATIGGTNKVITRTQHKRCSNQDLEHSKKRDEKEKEGPRRV
ncbi:MAG TPA: hypothetical protein VH415_06210 [Nitrososphaeraceae archaeon]